MGVDLEDAGVTPQQVAEIQALVDNGTINDKLARQVFEGVIAGEGTLGGGQQPRAHARFR